MKSAAAVVRSDPAPLAPSVNRFHVRLLFTILVVSLTVAVGVVMKVGSGDANSSGSAVAAGAGIARPATPVPSSSWSVTGQPDACRTANAAEVSSVLGVTVAPGISTDSWPPNCAFRLPGTAVEYLYTFDTSTATAAADFDRERKTAKITEPVTGLGDTSFWVPDTTELNVLTGTTYVVVKFGGSAPPPGAKEKAIALARITVPRSTPSAVK